MITVYAVANRYGDIVALFKERNDASNYVYNLDSMYEIMSWVIPKETFEYE